VLLFSQGASISRGSLIARNIKTQTKVQEWIHWKKYALDSADFGDYKISKVAELPRLRQQALDYIKSDKGRECVLYEKKRPLARLGISIAAGSLSCVGAIIVWLVNENLMKSRGITITELWIQRFYRLRPFTEIRPHLVSDGGARHIAW
jgi:hypothetical protein